MAHLALAVHGEERSRRDPDGYVVGHAWEPG
jgi:hypothetical protein